MNRNLIYISLLIIIFSCQNKRSCDFDTDIRKQNDSIIASLESNPMAVHFWKNYLYRSDEPSLKSENKETYRLIIYNTLSESSEIYRIYDDNGHFKFIKKKLEPRNNPSEKDTVLEFNEKVLNKEQWNEIKNLTKITKFWNLPVDIDRRGLHGQSWFLEGQQPNKMNCTERAYQIVSRWNPIDSTEFMKLSRKIIELEK